MKIVGIGLSKTGTTSLRIALQILGYNAIGWSERAANYYSQSLFQKLEHEYVKKFDAFTSEPWAQMYKFFDLTFDCKFICTHRNKEDWYKSLLNQVVSRQSQDNLKLVYPFSDPANEKDKMMKYFEKWYDDIFQNFFTNWPILHINIENIGWDEVCKFLDKPIPDEPFPYINKGTDHNSDYKKGEK